MAIPQDVNFQGRLTDENGVLLGGTYSMTFNIYSSYTGGSSLWTSGVMNVVVDSNGIYNVVLEDVDLDFSNDYYLGITVEADSEMSPRLNMSSSPYAFRAQNISIQGVGVDANFDMGSYNLTFGSGRVGIGTASPFSQLHVNGETAHVSFGTIASTGDVHIGSSGIGSPSSGDQDYGFYVGYNAYRGSDGDWYHSRTSTVDAGVFAFESAVASGGEGFYWRYTANDGAGAISMTDLMVLNTAGEVGIGTVSPQNDLNVIGDGNFTGTVYVGGEEVLTTSDAAVESDPYWSGNLSSATGTGNVVLHTSPTFATGITVPANSISDDELDEGANFDWTGAHTFASTVTMGSGVNLQFADAGTYIDGTATGMVIEPDDTLTINADTSINMDANTLYVDASSNEVGVGTSNPGARFEVVGAATSDVLVNVITAAAEYDSRLMIGETSAAGMVLEYDGVANIAGIRVGNSGASSSRRIQFPRDTDYTSFMAGNVGIGTVTPQNELNVIGDGNFTGTVYSNGEAVLTTSSSVSDVWINSSGEATGALTTDLNIDSGTFVISYDDNQVGIGNSGPASILEVGLDTAGQSNTITLGKGYDAASGIDWSRGGTVDSRIQSDSSENLIFDTDLTNALASTTGHFIFRSNGGSELVRITTSGNVGIGADSPAANLEIKETGTTNTKQLMINYSGGGGSTSHTAALLYLDESGTGNFRPFIAAEDMFVVTSSGRVGIGDTTPTDKLEVYGGNLRLNGSGAIDPLVKFADGGGVKWSVGLDDAGHASGGDAFIFAQNDGIGTNEYLVIDSTGQVGIGTTNPTQELDVNGQLSFGANLGDVVSLYDDRIDGTTMYGFGVESGALYYKANGAHRWYSGVNADGGVSGIMELTSGGDLLVAGDINTTGGDVCIDGGNCLSDMGTGSGTVTSVTAGDGMTDSGTATDPVLDIVGGSGLTASADSLDLGALTGDWDAGGYEIRARTLESDVATGTAPLTVASTTKVTNLNADMVDDSDSDVLKNYFRNDDYSSFINIDSYMNANEIAEALGMASTGISTCDDSTAPAPGCFEVSGYRSSSGAALDYWKVDSDSEYIFETWVKVEDGGSDTDERLYAGWSMYDENKTYFGNTQRYWGSAGQQFDEDSNNDGEWHLVRGRISGVGGSIGNFISGTEYVKPVILFNYNGGNSITRFAGMKLYKSREAITSLYVMDSTSGVYDNDSSNKLVVDNSGNVYPAALTATGAITGATINTGSGAMELRDDGIANGETTEIPTSDDVYDFVVGQGYVTGVSDVWVNSSGDIMSGTLDMGSNLITNIGNTGTDFVSGGGLNLAGNLQIGSYTKTSDSGFTMIADSGYDSVFSIGEESANYGFTIRYDGSSTNDLYFTRHENSAVGSVMMALDRDTGYVGIGDVSPGENLEVSAPLVGSGGSYTDWPEIRITSQTDGTYYIGDIMGRLSYYTDDTGGNFPATIAAIDAVSTRGNGIAYPDSGLSFKTTTSTAVLTERMVIESEGDVGIGTSSPEDTLHVAGGVIIDL